jgi:hypothetical protein
MVAILWMNKRARKFSLEGYKKVYFLLFGVFDDKNIVLVLVL